MKWLILICLMQLFSMATAWADLPRYVDRTIEREGIQLNVRIEALDGTAPATPQTGQLVRLSLDGKRLADDQILGNWRIGAWLDRETDTMSGAVPVCGQRVARYLSGNLIERPLLDLTGYYVLSLDAESSVSVFDPPVSFNGRSSLYFPFSAEVTLITDKSQAISVQVVRSGQRSVVFGLGNGQLELRYMPANADVQVGDILVTSGLDGIFLPGFPVAKVVNVERDSAYSFARIFCTPLAGVENFGELMVLDPRKPLPEQPPEAASRGELKEGQRVKKKRAAKAN